MGTLSENTVLAKPMMILPQMVEQNTRQVEQRDEEIRRIVESIAELQSIFSDLANLVADQGTVLDRIDYNMEQTVVKVTFIPLGL